MRGAEDTPATPLKLALSPTPVDSDSSPEHREKSGFIMNMDSSLEEKLGRSDSTPEKPVATFESPDDEVSHPRRVASFHFPATKFLSPFSKMSEVAAIQPLAHSNSLCRSFVTRSAAAEEQFRLPPTRRPICAERIQQKKPPQAHTSRN
jgi:hypothetical protein